MNPMIMKKLNLEGDFMLDEALLQMPIKKSKQLQDLIKLKIEEQKLIEQANTKIRSFKQSKANLPPSKENPLKTAKNKTVLQKQFKITNPPNNAYLVGCIQRALRYRKLAIDDVVQIFAVDAQMVEEIDRLRRLKEMQSNDEPFGRGKSQKVSKKRENMIKDLQMKLKNVNYDRYGQMSHNSFTMQRSFNQPSLYSSRVSHTSNGNAFSNYELSSLIQSAKQRQQEEDNLFEYQKLLRNKPPHRLDDKVKAMVEILKKHPNIMQKEIIQILAKDYGITNMTQTSVSRYYKKIYEMRKHCGVLLEAKKQGFIDI